jgi:hypothetical protein
LITYLQAKQTLAKYKGIAGSCVTDPNLDIFVREVLQYLLYNGSYGSERKFCFCAQNGCITLPQELEVPLKVQISGKVSSVWNRWFEYHSGNHLEDPCLAQEALADDPNRYPTVYNVPRTGSKVGIIGTCFESDDASVIVKGLDATGREIFTMHKGEQIVGEYLSIKKDVITKSSVAFAQITEISKSPTKGYCTLLAVDDHGRRQFLSDYTPVETNPTYRRMRLLKRPYPDICTVSILGRVRLKDYYSDTDLIPFDNLLALEGAGNTINSLHNKDLQNATATSAFIKDLIEAEGEYKNINNGQPFEVFQPLSGGAVLNARAAGRHFRLGGYLKGGWRR